MAEPAQITVSSVAVRMQAAIAKFAPGWEIANCGEETDPVLLAEWTGRKDVLATQPLDGKTGCTLSGVVEVPPGGKAALRIVVGHDPQGDFGLIVRVQGTELLREPVSPATTTEDHWLTQTVDLSAYAGKSHLRLNDHSTGGRLAGQPATAGAFP